jgi:hypothetical protein
VPVASKDPWRRHVTTARVREERKRKVKEQP